MLNKQKIWLKEKFNNLFSNKRKPEQMNSIDINPNADQKKDWNIQMQATLNTQSTPNPNALKFILSTAVKTSGKVSYEDQKKCQHIPLAKSLFNVPGVKRIHFSDCFITITKKAESNWEHIERPIKELILDLIKSHDPEFDEKQVDPNRPGAVQLTLIEGILDRTVRPYLQSDGGDLELISYIDDVLTMRYEGACGGCPSAEAGTLDAIVGVLRDEFNPDIDVVTI